MSDEITPQPSPVSIEEALRIYRGRGYHVEHPEDGVYLLAKSGVQQVWTEETLREAAAKLVNGRQVKDTTPPAAPAVADETPIHPPAPPPATIDKETGEVLPVTEEMRLEARRVHEDIIHHGSRSLEHLAGMAVALKEMRDRKLFLALGYNGFAEYCEQGLKMTARWANAQIQATEVLAGIGNPGSRIGSVSHLRLLARVPAEERQEFVQQHDLTSMTKRETEIAVANWKRKAEEAERKAAQALAQAQELAARPVVTQVVEKPVPDPAQQAEIDRLRRDLDQTSRQYTALLSKAEGQRQADAELQETRQKLAAMVARMERLGLQFDDEGRDQNGGLKLLEAVDPIHQVISRVLGDVQVLKRTGVGGWCEEERVTDLSKRLRDLAGLLDEILQDRRTRPINVKPVEVR